jgi:uncharacterized membrane protein
MSFSGTDVALVDRNFRSGWHISSEVTTVLVVIASTTQAASLLLRTVLEASYATDNLAGRA